MQIRIFSLNINSDMDSQEEMNKFLRSHRIIEVKQQYDETRGIWAFAVSYIDKPSSVSFQQRSDKIDYKNILDEPTFEIFSRLREIRKMIAKDESVPAYAIFTDKELSAIASLKDITMDNIVKIEGINTGRAEKYGVRIIQDYLNTINI